MSQRELTESQMLRLENMFRKAFSRELTPEERKFLALSVAVEPDEEQDLPIARKASA